MKKTSYLGSDFEIKSVQVGERVISGYAAVIGTMDKGRDILDAGAFTKTLQKKTPGQVAVFIGHAVGTLPMGIPQVIRVEGKGLYTETKIKPGPMGDDLLETARFFQEHGQPLGLSIGYYADRSRYEAGPDQKTARRLLDVDLIEYSFAASQIVMHPDALVVGVKTRGTMGYRIEQKDGRFCVYALEDNHEVGSYESETVAAFVMNALSKEVGEDPVADAYSELMKTEDIQGLPDASFLYVEEGDKGPDGKTLLHEKRHFPYRNADGSLNVAQLKVAIAELPTSTVPKEAAYILQARARRLLEHSTKTGVESAVWKEGSAPELRALGYHLIDLSEGIADDQEAMRLLELETKAGRAMGNGNLSNLHDLTQRVTLLHQASCELSEDCPLKTDQQKLLTRYQYELNLLEV